MNSLAWSPKGDEIWFGCSFRGDEWAIYAVDLHGRPRVVTELPFVGHVQDLLPDGRALVTMHDDRGETMARAPGAAEDKNVSCLDWSYALHLSADGRQVLLWEFGNGGARSHAVYLRPTDGSAPAVLVGDTVFDDGSAWFSPDAKWLLLMRGSSPPELRLVPTGPGESRSIRPQGLELQRAPVYRDQSCSRTAAVWCSAATKRDGQPVPGSRTPAAAGLVPLHPKGSSWRLSRPTTEWCWYATRNCGWCSARSRAGSRVSPRGRPRPEAS